MKQEHITPELMSKLAKTVDHILNPTVKGETGFCIFVYPHQEGDIDALYVSNSVLEDTQKAVRTWLSRSDEAKALGMPPVNHTANDQRSNQVIKDEITRKYQGKRVKDITHNEEFDYNESRDWQAIYHYPDRFEIVGGAIGEEAQDV